MQNNDANAPKSPLDFIAEAYWDDYRQGRPIDTGALFEDELRQCVLDDSVDSLHQIDALLDKVHAQNSMRPDLFMQDTRSHNLVLFIAFYIGRVLTNALQTQGEWMGQKELKRYYPQLPIHPNNPFHFMALHYAPASSDAKSVHTDYDNTADKHNPLGQHINNDRNSQSHQSEPATESLFFVLEPIAIRIFGKKLKMPPVVGESIANSVFEAVLSRLPEVTRSNVLQASRHRPNENKESSQQDIATKVSLDNTDTANADINHSLNTDTKDTIDIIDTNEILKQSSFDKSSLDKSPLDKSYLDKSSLNKESLTKNPLNQRISSVQNSSPISSPTDKHPLVQDKGNKAKQIHPNSQTKQRLTTQSVKTDHLSTEPNKTDEISATSVKSPSGSTAISNINTVNANTVYTIVKSDPSQSSDNSVAKVNPAAKANLVTTNDEFYDLRNELDTLHVEQDSEDEALEAMYLRAVKVLKKADKIIASAKSENSSDEAKKLYAEAGKGRIRALAVIKKAADSGYTAAMLRLSIYFFTGEGVKQDTEKGFDWVKRAANLGDIRGMRQMSRLYYKGLGCEQNMEMGKHWLEKAADNGHAEAFKLIENWNMAQTLIDESKYEKTIDQRYYILIGGVVILAIIIVILL